MYGEENSKGANARNHTHYHHHLKNSKKLKDDSDDDDKIQQQSLNEKSGCISEMSSQGKVLDGGSKTQNQPESLQKRKIGSGARADYISDAPNGSTDRLKSVVEKEPSHSPSNLAGAMLGDAFLHQLPHAFEKIMRYGEENSKGANAWNHTHHYHHHKNSKKLKDDNDDDDKIQQQSLNKKNECISEMSSQGKVLDRGSKMKNQPESLQKRKTGSGAGVYYISNAPNGSTDRLKSMVEKEPSHSPSNLVFDRFNGHKHHNFADGMALGSAFLLYGSVGGWSRTLYLLAHELPQEIGDFGILVRFGFSVTKALFFNFFSALVVLARTALALVMGQDLGQSSSIEGFTAGKFVYIAIARVLAEVNDGSSLAIKSTTF
ncbi:unnamed protein product [Camellia sinensis]